MAIDELCEIAAIPRLACPPPFQIEDGGRLMPEHPRKTAIARQTP